MIFINAKPIKVDNAVLFRDKEGGILFLLNEKCYFIKGDIVEVEGFNQSINWDGVNTDIIRRGIKTSEIKEIGNYFNPSELGENK